MIKSYDNKFKYTSIQISPHFSLWEFVRSDKAKLYQIDNTPTDKVINNIKTLCLYVLEPLRVHFNVPIDVSSGFRCVELNTHKSIKGSTTSDHVFGKAADILSLSRSVQNSELFSWIRHNISFDQLIWEFGTNKNPSWVHVSFRSLEKNRKQVLQAYENKDKKTCYKKVKKEDLC